MEPHRPGFHFTPPSMWMNDPNGMVYYEGEYHLFYQYHPESAVWGPMHWGHAVSTDMVHWTHLPIALYPDDRGLIFSGSAVVDWKNTSGFGKDGKPPLVAIFTQHLMEGEKAGRSDFQYQSIAYSNDRGRTWTKYAGNPVVPNTKKIKDFRDPKVIWDEASNQWVMVFAAQDHVKIWGSNDLKKWNHLSDFGQSVGAHGGVWECPDFFPMTIEGSNEKRWVLLQSLNPGSPNGGSGTQYFVGNFDGKTFTLDPAFSGSAKKGSGVWLDWGRDNYAGVTWSDVPVSDGRRLFLGWMSNWDYAMVVPTEKWRSAMTLPRTLNLVKTATGPRLISQPVKELETLRGKKYSLAAQTLEKSYSLTDRFGFSPASAELILDFDLASSTANRFGIELSNSKGERYLVGYNVAKNHFFSDRMHAGDLSFSNKFAERIHIAPRSIKDNKIQLHIFFDVASAELFADGGLIALTDIFFPGEAFSRAQIFVEDGSVKLLKAECYRIRPAR